MAGVALVTGATTGIGRELVRLLARDRHAVVLVARDQERLDGAAAEARSLGAPLAEPLAADLARPEAPAAIAAELARRGHDVDVLVNNAGFGALGSFAAGGLEEQLGMIAVNVAALVELTHRVLPGMLAGGRGRILNVASTAAFQAGPYLAVYYATKAFVLSFSEALREELRGSGVTVTCLCPGPTRTGFQLRSGMDRLSLIASRRLRLASADAVAAAGYRGLLAGRRLVVPGLLNKIGVTAVKLAPRALAPRLIARFQRR